MTSLVSTAFAIIVPVLACAGLLLGAGSAHAGRPEGPLPLAGRADNSELATTARFALVIGSNETKSKKQKPLRYADDDAARIAELWLELGAEVELLTVFDQTSQARFPGLVKQAEQPTTAELDAAWARLRAKMQAAADAGNEVELLIYYAGHGDVGPDGQGFLTLANGDTLTRSDLFTRLLGTSPADHNHLIVDACRSEQFVLSRGDWTSDRGTQDYADSVREYLDGNHLGAHPDTGVVLARSVDQQTHEWERWQGGIFTHELLSGLRGGADLNGDGAIEYSELGAFVSAANSGVGDPHARLDVAVRPPRGDERAPLLVHERVTDQRVLLLAGGDAGHYSLEATSISIAMAKTGRAPVRPASARERPASSRSGGSRSPSPKPTLADRSTMPCAPGCSRSPMVQGFTPAIRRMSRCWPPIPTGRCTCGSAIRRPGRWSRSPRLSAKGRHRHPKLTARS
jgi:hypothetical protein